MNEAKVSYFNHSVPQYQDYDLFRLLLMDSKPNTFSFKRK